MVPVSIKGELYMTFQQVTSLGINTESTVKDYLTSGKWASIRDPKDARKVLIAYTSLPEAYKNAIREKHGDPEAKQAIENATPKKTDLSVYWHIDAQEREELDALGLFDPTDKDTPVKMLDLLTAAAVCRWFQGVKPSKTEQYGYANKLAMQEAIHAHPRVQAICGFYTANFRAFQRKFTDYKTDGIKGLVSKKLGNQNNLKLRDEAQMETLRRLYASSNNRDIVWVTEDYNKVARLNEWPELSEGTVGDFLDKEAKLQAILFRNGVSKFKSDVLPTIHRDRPSLPGYLWEGDGTPWELYYQYVKDGKTVYWGRKVVYIITDASFDLPLGWAIGDSESAALITAAWRNAIMNTQMLPWQIRVDNFAKKAMGSLYEQITQYFTPTGVGNARAKLIEQMFGRFSATRILKEYPNWSGCNITNRLESNQPNREFLDSEKKNFPDEAGVIAQINESINKFRNAIIKKDGLPRFDQWCAKVRETSKLRMATPEQLIDIFGTYRDEINKAYTYQFSKDGLEMVIDGVSHYYMDWSVETGVQNYQELYGAQNLRVKYLPEDLNMIRVDHPQRKKVYYLRADKKIPGCIMDMKDNPEGRDLLYDKLTFHKALIGALVAKHDRTIKVTNDVLQSMTVDAEGALKSMFTVDGGNKQYLNNAKSVMKALDRTITERQLEDMYDEDVPEPIYNEPDEDLYD